MANDKAPKAASGGATVLIVGVSVVMIAALMGWLYMQSSSRDVATVAEGDSAAAAPAAVAGPAPSQVVTSAVFEPNVKSYIDQVVQLTDARYQAGLSRATFWIELPTGAPYLVKLDSALLAGGTALPAGGVLDIIGTVKQKDNALVGQWMASGVLENEDQRMQAEFGTTYLEARQIRPAGQ